MAGVVASINAFIQQYGLLAVFVYMFLESALLLHFAPSEVVLPFAAALLVHGPVGFVVFVAVATAGGTAGSIVVYYVFRRGEFVLERYGTYLHLSPENLEHGRKVFHRWGEGTVFFVGCFRFFGRSSAFRRGLRRWTFVGFCSTRRLAPPCS